MDLARDLLGVVHVFALASVSIMTLLTVARSVNRAVEES